MVTLKDAQIDCTVNATSQYRDKTGLSTMATTGSITSGTSSLVVASALDFRIGDWIIVEIGGESGAGARGTIGVGGAWPTLSYANATAMNADTSQVDQKLCWLVDTGTAYYWNDAGNVWVQVPSGDYYFAKAFPLAMWAQITNISGTTFTLSKTASASATNANVYFDNWGILNELITNNNAEDLPTGTFYVSDYFPITGLTSRTISGAGIDLTTIKTPNGARHGGIDFLSGSDGGTVQDLELDCNFKLTGISMRWPTGRAGNNASADFYRPTTLLGRGIYFSVSDDGVIRRVRVRNAAMQAFCTAYSANVWAYNCIARVEDPQLIYTQWQYNWTDGYGNPGGAMDCEIDSDWYVPGFEAFRSRGVQWIRCSSRNAVWSDNSSDGTINTNCVIELEDDKRHPDQPVNNPFAINNPVLNVNYNIGEGYNTDPMVITNLTLTHGRTDTSGARFIGISQVATACPITLVGTYDSDFVTPKGLVKNTAAWAGSGVESFGGLAIRANGTVTVTGMRFRGEAPEGRRTLCDEGASASITATDSIFDSGTDNTGTFIDGGGNLTNAAFDALHPGLP